MSVQGTSSSGPHAHYAPKLQQQRRLPKGTTINPSQAHLLSTLVIIIDMPASSEIAVVSLERGGNKGKRANSIDRTLVMGVLNDYIKERRNFEHEWIKGMKDNALGKELI